MTDSSTKSEDIFWKSQKSGPRKLLHKHTQDLWNMRSTLTLFTYAGLHEMEGHSIRKTETLDRLGARGEVSGNEGDDIELARPFLRVPRQKRLPFPRASRRRRRRHSGTDARFSSCPASHSLSLTEMLCHHWSGIGSSFGSLTSNYSRRIPNITRRSKNKLV